MDKHHPTASMDSTPDHRDLYAEKLPELRGIFESILCIARSPRFGPTVGNIELADRLIDAVVSWSENSLPQPEPEGPTDEETEEAPFLYAPEWYNNEMAAAWEAGRNSGWRDALARWGRPAIKPVPVSERLPEPKDCDSEGRCWLCVKAEGAWRLLNPANSGVPQLKYCFSHWLPHHALPVPKVQP